MRARRLLRPIVRRLLPGAPVGGDPVPTRTAPVPGTTAVVTEQGAGPPILLVHAGSATGSAWTGVAAALSDRFRVLRYNRPTYRDDPPSGGAAAMAAEVHDLLAVAATAERPPLVVGHSSGAVVVLQAALAEPARFAGMVLYEPPVAVGEPLGGEPLRRARAALDAGDPGRAIAVHLRELVGTPGFGVALMRLVPPLWQTMRRFAPGQIADDEALESLGVGLDRYARLDVPAVLLGGGRSPAHLRARLDALAGVLPAVDRVVVLPGQGHLATLRAPGEVARVVAAFADRVLR